MDKDELRGLLPGGLSAVYMLSASESHPIWEKAETKISEILGRIQPSRPSELQRQAVADFVQDLIYRHVECKVFPFGSVPLKTYLPDGDIDLCAFNGFQQINETWANELCLILEREEKNPKSKFHVKEVQRVHAEVQIVKCLVENIIVDISFNQLGGLCTLCFLEEVDHLIGRSHLFKRSIILVKAWCYYESRILGAHHGLISTYALETLVLYIFHVFNTSLRGPLEVLFRFLEFFSMFDWEHYCLSLWGPIPVSSLPNMTAEPPHVDEGNLLLTQSFLDTCSLAYGVIPGGAETHGRTFSQKFMNIVDPLRTNNNLGRSISKGNFFRIRSAFSYGAKKLEKILCGSQEEIGESLSAFFMNTEKHGNGQRPDASFAHIPLLEEDNSQHCNESTNGKPLENFVLGNNNVMPKLSDMVNGLKISDKVEDREEISSQNWMVGQADPCGSENCCPDYGLGSSLMDSKKRGNGEFYAPKTPGNTFETDRDLQGEFVMDSFGESATHGIKLAETTTTPLDKDQSHYINSSSRHTSASYASLLSGEKDIAMSSSISKGNKIPKLKNSSLASRIKGSISSDLSLITVHEEQCNRYSSINSQPYVLTPSLRRTSSANMLPSLGRLDSLPLDSLSKASKGRVSSKQDIVHSEKLLVKEAFEKIDRKGKEVDGEPSVGKDETNNGVEGCNKMKNVLSRENLDMPALPKQRISESEKMLTSSLHCLDNLDSVGILPFNPATSLLSQYNTTPSCNKMWSAPVDGNLDLGLGVMNGNAEAGKSIETSTNEIGTSHIEMGEGAEAVNGKTSDVLQGNLAVHRYNLELGRLFQLHGPFLFTSPMLFPPKYAQGWEGPGRPSSMGMQVFSHLPFIPFPGVNAQHQLMMSNGFSGKELPKHQRGTGTYLPNPRPGWYRDRHSSAGVSGRGGAHHRGGTGGFDRHGGQAFVPRNRGRGQNKLDVSAGAKLGGAVRSTYQHHEGNKGGTSTHHLTGRKDHSDDSFKSNNHPPIVMVYPYYPTPPSPSLRTEELEFGSLGPSHFGGGVMASPSGTDADLSDTLSVHVGSDKDPRKLSSHHHHHQRVSYELKDEDFPPLSPCDQSGRSPNFNAQRASTNGRDLYQSFVVGPS